MNKYVNVGSSYCVDILSTRSYKGRKFFFFFVLFCGHVYGGWREKLHGQLTTREESSLRFCADGRILTAMEELVCRKFAAYLSQPQHLRRENITALGIAGGVEIDIEQFPHQAQVVMYGQTACGGVVISARVILTAAHCVVDRGATMDPKKLEVYLGSSRAFRGVVYHPCALKHHHLYRENSREYYFYDIALMLLKNKIKFGPKIQMAKIVPHEKWKNPKYTMTVTGFGFMETEGHLSKHLRMTRMRYVDHETCNESPTSDGSMMPVPSHMFCMVASKWTSDCYGDSGSGVMWRDYLVGIVGSGRDIACGSETLPSMYTDVTYFRKWIISGVKELESRAIGSCIKPKKWAWTRTVIENEDDSTSENYSDDIDSDPAVSLALELMTVLSDD